jgi:hypothetical protein
VASITHQLGRAEAKRRIGTLLERVCDLGGVWSQRWSGDSRLSVEGQLQGQAIAGEVSIKDRCVDAVVTLPWAMVLLAGRIKRWLEQSARQVLSEP